jgi:cbb3-type cytochrome oxidase subunit 3
MARHSGTEVTSYAGGIVSIGSALTLTEVGIIVGIATALLTFALNAFYMFRKDCREKAESEARLKLLQDDYEQK